MPALSKKLYMSEPTDSQVPSLDSDALRSLTEKIESSFKNQGKRAISGDTPARSKTKVPDVKKKEGLYVANAPALNSAAKIAGNCGTTIGKQKPTVAPRTSQGKKRLRDGRGKEESYGTKAGGVNSIKLGTRNSKIRSDKHNNIHEEVRALGGTKEDVDLIADVMSDSEMENEDSGWSKDLDNGFERDIEQLVRQLGVDRVGKKELIADSQSEGADEVGGLADTVHLDIIPSNKVAFNVKSALQTTTSIGKGQRSLTFRPQSEWHAVVLPPLNLPSQRTSILPSDLLDRLHTHAKALLEYENTQYGKFDRSATSAHRFYSTIMSTGTLSDKISALTLSVQESPVHSMKELESMVGLAGKRSRGQAVEVLGALKDLFGPGNLLPSDRKLRVFASQPALSCAFHPANFHWTTRDQLPSGITEAHLISWAYEDWLKSAFFQVLGIIETWCNDEVVFARGKAVDYVYQLLKEKPEQEANLLRLLVNKLGDPDKKIASKTSFNILQLEAAHPLMKPTIIAAIESDVLFRPGQSLHAKYYASITLNQTVLSGGEGGVARKLLDVYFDLFIKLLEKPERADRAATKGNGININSKGEIQGGGGSAGKRAQKNVTEKEKMTIVDEDLQEKTLSAVLTGVNRAIPFTDTSGEAFERSLDTLFKVTHSSNFNTSIQALMLIQQLNGGSTDRFYRTLYESFLDPRLLASSKQALYLNLLFRALKSDVNVRRVKAFAKRLLQVVAMHQPSFTCAALYLLRELEGVFVNREAFLDHTEGDDSEEEKFQDVKEQSPYGMVPGDRPSSQKTKKPVAKYNGRKRDPEHSNADRSSLWEVTPFLLHYHPSVSLFATRFLHHNEMPPKPDLSLNTLIHFLDRFVYRNPKVTNTLRGASVMQPMASVDSSALLVSAYSNKSSTEQPVNSEAFWKQASEKVNANEVFFHRYFSTLGRGKEKASKKKAERTAETEGSEGEGDEDDIWKALVESRSELDERSDSGFGDEGTESDMAEMDDDGLDSRLSKEKEGAEGLDYESLPDLDDDDDEDDEALLDSEDDVPSDLEEAFRKEATSSELELVAKPTNEKPSGKRRRLNSLPTFASAESYAKMLEEDG